MVVIVEAEDAEAAYNRLDDLTLDAGHRDIVYLSDACSMVPAERYETNQIAMTADGELAVAAPEDVKQSRKAEYEREVERLEGEGRR